MSASVVQPLSSEEGQPFNVKSSGAGSDGSGRKSGGSKIVRAFKAPFKAVSRSQLLDKTAPYFSGIHRFGVSKLSAFWNDPFHTLLNLPWGSFIMVFFSTYIMLYLVFAFIYWLQGSCMVNPNDTRATFTYALWMSSRVASTLGFDVVHPNADCSFINFCVMIQVIASSLINFVMLGVVFARFSAPFKRASTVRFSKVAIISRHPSGYWALTLRVANLRKHQILQPAVRLVVTAVDSITPSYYHHEQLQIEGAYKQLTNLELGFPAHISHVMTPDSFLYNLSLLEMDTRMMEVLVFVDGIDAMTSKHMSARIAYSTSDIYMNEQFAPMNLEMRGKHLGLDFKDFDKTVPALDPALLLDLNEAQIQQQLQHGSNNGAMGGLWQLRHQSFRKLAERYAHLGISHAACAALGMPVPMATGTGRTSSGGVASQPALPASPHTSRPPLVVPGAAGTAAVAMSAAGLLPPMISTGVAPPNHPLAAMPPTPGQDQSHALLLPGEGGHAALASHVSGVTMAASTSGMPFAVARAAHQDDAAAGGLSSLFRLSGGKHGSMGGGGSAWTSTHAQQPAGGGHGAGTGGGSGVGESQGVAAAAMAADSISMAGGGKSQLAMAGNGFVVLPALHRGGTGAGTAWQQSALPVPTTLGLAPLQPQPYHAAGTAGDLEGAPSGTLGTSTTSPLFKPPLPAPPAMYSLTSDEGPVPHNNSAAPATTSNPFALPLPFPTSHNASDKSEKHLQR